MWRRYVFAFCFVGLFAAGAAVAQQSPLVGTWRLVAFEGEFQDTGEKIYDWGKSPRGMVIFTADGYYSVVIEAQGRKAPQTDADRAELWKSVTAYSGTYRSDGEKHVNKVEVSWNPAMVGTEQVRFHKLEGDRMIATTAWGPSPRYPGRMARGHLIWERVK